MGGNLKLFLHKAIKQTPELEWKLYLLKIQKPNCYFHQSEHNIKFDCNPKYTIPYVKVCDNVYLTK